MGRGDYTQDDIDNALTAYIAYAGNASAAVRHLKSDGKRAPTITTLINWTRTVYWERYEELREKFAEKNENTLANNYLDAARRATETAMLAIERSHDRLMAGEDQDPARTAANLARVAQSATDKRLSLQGRPTSITENRDATEILRALVAKGILIAPEATPEIEASAGE